MRFTESIPQPLQVPQAGLRCDLRTKLSSTLALRTRALGLLADSASQPFEQLPYCGGACLSPSGLQCFISESRAWGRGELQFSAVMLLETICSSLKGGCKGPQQPIPNSNVSIVQMEKPRPQEVTSPREPHSHLMGIHLSLCSSPLRPLGPRIPWVAATGVPERVSQTHPRWQGSDSLIHPPGSTS